MMSTAVDEAFTDLSPEEQARRLLDLATSALAHWELDAERLEPIKVRENAVYAIHLRSGARAVLRVHRHGYHSDASLESEYLWLSALGASEIEVPRFLPTRHGHMFARVCIPGVSEPRQVDLLEWIDGHPLGAIGDLSVDEREIERIYGTVGELAAAMHNHSSTWSPPPGFRRHAWDAEGLVGEEPLWGRFWELAALTSRQRHILLSLRSRLRAELSSYGAHADWFGLIHADLVPENILVTRTGPRIIDFDDAGYGWHMFELATSLYFIRREPYYECARKALLAGYRRRRPLPEEHVRLLPLFLAVRGTTYLGWVHTRRRERVSLELTPQLIDLAIAAAKDYLD
jgi:Ser/Thr protein kinase RdoA (MazF antagonist)